MVLDAGVSIRPVAGLRFYLSGATLFRYPALDEQADINFANQFETDLDPERGLSVDLGGELEPAPWLGLAVGGYWMEMDDEIRYVYDPATFSGSNQNVGATRRFGADVDLRLQPTSVFSLDAGYSWVTATFQDGENDGARVPLTAEHQIDGALTVAPFALLSFGARGTYRGPMYQGGDPANEQDPIAAAATGDLFVQVTPPVPGELTLSAEVINVADTVHAPVQFYSSFSGTAYYPAPGREWRVSAAYRY